MCNMTTCTMKFRLLVANTPHDGGMAIPTGEHEFSLLVQWSAPENILARTISTSFLTFHKIKHFCP